MHRLGLYVIGFLLLEMMSIVALSLITSGEFTMIVIIIGFFLGIFMFKKQSYNFQNMLASLLSGRGLNENWYQKIGPVRYNIVALLLISPGVFSDIVALFLLLLKNRTSINQHEYNSYYTTRPHQSESQIIEGEFRELAEKKKEE